MRGSPVSANKVVGGSPAIVRLVERSVRGDVAGQKGGLAVDHRRLAVDGRRLAVDGRRVEDRRRRRRRVHRRWDATVDIEALVYVSVHRGAREGGVVPAVCRELSDWLRLLSGRKTIRYRSRRIVGRHMPIRLLSEALA
jgi:hypothetical protein